MIPPDVPATQIAVADPYSPEAIAIIQRYWKVLREIYGDTEASPFQPSDIAGPRCVFVMAWVEEQAVGCGAIRPHAPGIAELKRMFVDKRFRRQGIARSILAALEREAASMGYSAICLETGTGNIEALSFYPSSGYASIACYPPYDTDPISRCFEKRL